MRRVAVLLNRNAQRVKPKLVRLVESLVPRRDVLVTASEAEGRAAVERVIDEGYEALCVGGGDGTFMQVVRDLLEVAPEPLPVLMPLRLGTGNAIADVSGASKPTPAGLAGDITRAASDEPARALPLLNVGRAGGAGEERERVTHFTGVGLDAMYADDHRRIIKEGLRKGSLGWLFDGVLGHALAAAAGTLPRLALKPRPLVRIINTGAPARRLDDDGRPTGEPIPEGAVIHEGPITIAAASTISYYSSGIVFFPFADRLEGRFQLRVSSAGPLTFLPRLPAVFAGTYRNPRCLWDFEATAARFELGSPLPYHIGGDVQQPASAFSVALSRRTVPLLRRPPVPR